MKKESVAALTEFAAMAGVLFTCYCVAIFGGQVIAFLQTGSWTEAPAINLFLSSPFLDGRPSIAHLYPSGLANETWLDRPDSWLGLHRILFGILGFVHVSVFLLLSGGAMAVAGVVALDRLEKWHSRHGETISPGT